jgi:hypothetical protein
MELLGSSVNSTTNNFVKNLEKIFVLANLNSDLFSGGIYPEKVYKKDLSKELLNTALKASQDFFNGKHFNSTHWRRFGSYLDYLNRNESN